MTRYAGWGIPLALLTIISIVCSARESYYRVPERPPKFKMTTRSFGTEPGSKAPESAPRTAQYKRVYSYPARLRLLVRAECGAAIGRQQLIERTQNITASDGPHVQIDWDVIRSSRVAFYVVTYTEEKTLNIDLEAQGGKYVVKNKRKSSGGQWQVQRLSFDGGRKKCSEEKDPDPKEVRLAVINALNAITLRHFRSNPFKSGG